MTVGPNERRGCSARCADTPIRIGPPVGAVCVLLTFGWLVVPARLSAQEPGSPNRPVMTATYTEATISIDGVLDEAAWDAAEPATDFVQKDPSEGKPSSERTVVRVLYDRTNLYIGALCHDRSPGELIVRDINRDFDYLEQDSLSVLLDTFGDKRSGFMLSTTPRGGQLDIQILNENRDVNYNWDGIWYVQSHIGDQGWTAEFAVPLKTLRFSREAAQIWGIQFLRRIRRRNETTVWSPVPHRYSNFQMSLNGTLQGLDHLAPGMNLTVKPYVAGGMERFASRNLGADGTFDAGGDAKYGVTPGLTLDLTVNTDFSQVEADTQQVNLSRFPLFFPEKREFFLENAGLFQLGEVYRLGPPRTEEVLLFFSRRIGLSEAREPLPILAGARLTGRAGGYYLGLMNIQTRSRDETPANNFTVARVRRDILANSDVGLMFINRQSSQRDYNRSFSADANFVFFRDLRMNTVVAGTRTPGLHGHDGMQKLEMTWQNNLVKILGSYLNVQENFNPEVGFVRRRGTIAHSELNVRHRFDRGSKLGAVLRDLSPHVIWEGSERPDGETDVKLFRPHVRVELQDGGGIEGTNYRNFERDTEPFTIRPGVVLPPGDYRFDDYQIWYFSNKSKPVSIDARYRSGEFYDGTKVTWKVSGSLKLGYRLTTTVDFEHNDVNLPEGAFLADLLGVRVNHAFSPRMFLNAFVQYNSDTNKVSSNIRFRFIHRPLSDLFVVYNEQRDRNSGKDDRVLTIKYTHLFGL